MSQTIKVPDELHEAIKSRASDEQRTIVTVLTRAFDLYVSTYPHAIEPRSIRAELADFVEQPEKALASTREPGSYVVPLKDVGPPAPGKGDDFENPEAGMKC